VTYTRPGSITGVGEAYELNGCTDCGLATVKTARSKRTLPDSLSIAIAESVRPSVVAVVTHTCEPRITGEDHARP
jgi:hypothetical protein